MQVYNPASEAEKGSTHARKRLPLMGITAITGEQILCKCFLQTDHIWSASLETAPAVVWTGLQTGRTVPGWAGSSATGGAPGLKTAWRGGGFWPLESGLPQRSGLLLWDCFLLVWGDNHQGGKREEGDEFSFRHVPFMILERHQAAMSAGR